jgi:hypothetical protein
LVFNLELSETSIKKEIDFQINTYSPLFYELGGYFDLKFYQGTMRDIATIDFYITSQATKSPIITLQVT